MYLKIKARGRFERAPHGFELKPSMDGRNEIIKPV
jgi:hypothetical protein